MIFELPYHITNNGDGSASAKFHPTTEAAEQADEEMDEVWGEPCNGSVTLKVEGGKLFLKSSRFNREEMTFSDEWIEVTG